MVLHVLCRQDGGLGSGLEWAFLLVPAFLLHQDVRVPLPWSGMLWVLQQTALSLGGEMQNLLLHG